MNHSAKGKDVDDTCLALCGFVLGLNDFIGTVAQGQNMENVSPTRADQCMGSSEENLVCQNNKKRKNKRS